MHLDLQVATFLANQGLGVLGESIFIGTTGSKDVNRFITVRQTGGDNIDTQQLPAADYTFQIQVRGDDPVEAQDRIYQIRDLFKMDREQESPLKNVELVEGGNGVAYTGIVSGPADLGTDASRRRAYSLNILIRFIN